MKLLIALLTVINPLILIGVAVYDGIKRPAVTGRLYTAASDTKSYLGRYFPARHHGEPSVFWGRFGQLVWG